MGSGPEWSDMVGKTRRAPFIENNKKKTKTGKWFLFHPRLHT